MTTTFAILGVTIVLFVVVMIGTAVDAALPGLLNG
jgi:hypothetical protein